MKKITDASVFELSAVELVTPSSQSELVKYVIKFLALKRKITLRAGGTSLAGQAIGSDVVVDISKHITKILSYQPDLKEITVEPGVIQDDLNDFVRGDGLRFAPDTSTSNRAMIGGMIGNNSCGSYSVYYGTTREHVKSVEIILADGSEATFGPLNESQLQSKLKQQDFEGNLYRTVFNLLDRQGKEILKNYPHPSIKRRNTGYALDELYRHHQPFNPQGKPFNLAPIICGSEGTLAVIKSATLNLVEQPRFRQLICAHFASLQTAMELVPELLALEPVAVELIDKATLDATKDSQNHQPNRFWIDGEPEAVLVCEWFADELTALNEQVLRAKNWLESHACYSARVIDSSQSSKVWELRKASLGALMGKINKKKAVAVVEDAAVPVTRLFDYFLDVQALMAELNVSCVYYGHASVGLIHVRPELDLADETDRELFKIIAGRISSLVKKYRGALSAEHGDGRLRAPFLKEQLGAQVYAYLLEVKAAFDPHNLLNPGVIIGQMDITHFLRSDRKIQQSLVTGFDWSADLSLLDAVEKCNGAAACRKSAGRGVMCPSYQATREENYSTRGRSNLLRHALTEKEPLKALAKHELRDALDLCLGCKACKTECPANVDLARLKSEVLFQAPSLSLSDWLSRLMLKNYGRILHYGRKYHFIFNWLQSRNAMKWVLGINLKRSLPKVEACNEALWVKDQGSKLSSTEQRKTVWVLCDLFSQYYEQRVAQAAFKTLEACQLQVKPVQLKSSPRALISKGLLKEARQALLDIAGQLADYQPGDRIVGIDPAELLVWRDEAFDLMALNSLQSGEQNCFFSQELQSGLANSLLFEELILELAEEKQLPEFKGLDSVCWIHVHCHQKSLAKTVEVKRALQLIPSLQVNVINAGCCGMSGEFGYKHYELSEKIANQLLMPAIRQVKEGELVVATGSSCRQQIDHFSSTTSPLHSAEVFAMALKS